MTEQVAVQFGGSTGGLDAAAAKAKADISSVGTTASGLKGTFSSVSDGFKNMFSGTNFGDVSTKMRTIRAEMKEVVEGAKGGTLQLGSLGRVFAEAASESAVLSVALTGLAIALGALFVAKEVLEFGEKMGEAAEAIDKVSQKLGMSTTQLQEWHGVAEQVNMSTQSMDGGFTRLERAMYRAANGGKAQASAFKQLGIDINTVKSPSEAVLQIADKFKDMDNGPKKVALAMQLMGRAGAEMIPILNEGRGGLEEMMKTSEDLGAVMSGPLVQAGKDVDEKFDELHLASTGIKNMFFEQLAPAISAIAGGMVNLAKRMFESYKAGGLVYQIVFNLVDGFKVLIQILVDCGVAVVSFGEIAIAAIKALIAPFQAVYYAVMRINDALHGGTGAWAGFKSDMGGVNASINANITAMNHAIAAGDRFKKALYSTKLGKPGHNDAADGDMDLSGDGAGGKKKKGKNGAAEAKREAKERLAIVLDELSEEQKAAEDDYDKWQALEQQKLDAIKKVYGQQSKEYQAELNKQKDMERKHAKDLDAIRKEATEHKKDLDAVDVQSEKDSSSQRIENERAALDRLVDLGKMSAAKRAEAEIGLARETLQNERNFESDMYGIKVAALQDELSLMTLDKAARVALNNQLELLEKQHVARMVAIDGKGAADIKKAQTAATQAVIEKNKQMLAGVTSSVTTMLSGILHGTTSLKKGMLQLADSIASSFLGMGVKILVNWIATQLGIKTADNATKTQEAATAAASAAAQKAVATAANFAQIMSLAPVAGAAAFASTAAIPIIGPALAPAAAATASAAVASMAPLALASGGFDIPSGVNPLTQLHQQEMVLPAHIANPLRSMLAGAGPRSSGMGAMSGGSGSSGGSGGAVRGGEGGENHYHFHGAMVQNPSQIRRWFEDNHQAVGAGVREFVRKGGNTAPSSR